MELNRKSIYGFMFIVILVAGLSMVTGFFAGELHGYQLGLKAVKEGKK